MTPLYPAMGGGGGNFMFCSDGAVLLLLLLLFSRSEATLSMSRIWEVLGKDEVYVGESSLLFTLLPLQVEIVERPLALRLSAPPDELCSIEIHAVHVS